MNTHTKKYTNTVIMLALTTILLQTISITASFVISTTQDITTLATTGTDSSITLTGINNDIQGLPYNTENYTNPIQGGRGFNPDQDSLSQICNNINRMAIPSQIPPIQGAGFDTNTNSLVAITDLLAPIPESNFSILEGPGFNTNTNSLVAITNDITALGTPPFANPLQVTAIQGAGFNTNTNSLVAISNTLALKPQPQNSLTAIEGSGFNTNTNSLVAITNDIKALGTGPFVTSNQITSAVAPIATTAQLTSACAPLATNHMVTSACSPLMTTTQLNNATSPIVTSTQLTNTTSLLMTSTQLTNATNRLATLDQANNIEGTNFTAADNLVAISQALAHASPVDLSPVEGIGFDTTQNSLVAITNNITRLGTTPLATSANLASAVSSLPTNDQLISAFASIATSTQLGDATKNVATTIQLNNAFQNIPTPTQLTHATNQLATASQLADAFAPLATTAQISSINSTLSAIQIPLGVIITKLIIDPTSQVNTAVQNFALTNGVTSNDTNSTAITLLAQYNKNIQAAINETNIAIATNTQSYNNTNSAITSLGTAITTFNALSNQWALDNNSRPSSNYSAAQISAALLQLNASLSYLLSNQAQK